MGKKRLSITIDDKLIEKIDKLVDGLYVKSRSDFVEKILKRYLEQDNIAVILCGGSNFYLEGTGIPRPLVEVGGKTIIERLLDKLRREGFNNVFVVGSARVLDAIESALEGKEKGVNMMYVVEPEPMGSAGVLGLLKKYIHTRFLVIPGDCVIDFDLRHMMEFHKTHEKIATLAVASMLKPSREQYMLGWVKMKGIDVVSYEERVSKADVILRSTGICIFEPQVFNYLGAVGGKKRMDLGDLISLLAKDKQVNGYIINGKWFNIHTNEDVREASSL